MINELSAERSETINGGSKLFRWQQAAEKIETATFGIGSPTINVSPSVSPVIITAPFLMSSNYSFNLLGNNNAFNTYGQGTSIINIG
jgi:hypothetical protein